MTRQVEHGNACNEENKENQGDIYPIKKKQKIGNIQVDEGVGLGLAVSHDASHEKYLDVTEKKMTKLSRLCQWQYQGATKVLMTGLNEDDEDCESESVDSDTVTQDNA
jgi:hypothetical protein